MCMCVFLRLCPVVILFATVSVWRIQIALPLKLFFWCSLPQYDSVNKCRKLWYWNVCCAVCITWWRKAAIPPAVLVMAEGLIWDNRERDENKKDEKQLYSKWVAVLGREELKVANLNAFPPGMTFWDIGQTLKVSLYAPICPSLLQTPKAHSLPASHNLFWLSQMEGPSL